MSAQSLVASIGGRKLRCTLPAITCWEAEPVPDPAILAILRRSGKRRANQKSSRLGGLSPRVRNRQCAAEAMMEFADTKRRAGGARAVVHQQADRVSQRAVLRGQCNSLVITEDRDPLNRSRAGVCRFVTDRYLRHRGDRVRWLRGNSDCGAQSARCKEAIA